MPLEILLVEDEPTLLATLGDALEEAGHQVTRHQDGGGAMQDLEAGRFDLVVTDVRLPDVEGTELARSALARPLPPAVVLMTAYGDLGSAVEMLKLGARDYLTKPFEEEVLVSLAARLEVAVSERDDMVVAASEEMKQVMALARRVGRTDLSVLITGETGSGKEIVARTVHASSPRTAGPIVAVNCAAIPGELIESELFGHTRGAFTGAATHREGWIRSADGGTLFLDEVGELSPGAQARLLRALDTHEVVPVGSERAVATDFRLVCATNRDLRSDQSPLRPDLLYRISAFELHVPPLRDRVQDVPVLVRHFLDDLRTRFAEVPREVTDEALAALVAYSWPGNVRELRNAIERAAVMAGTGPLRVTHLPPLVSGDSSRSERPLDLREAIGRVEAEQIRRALAVTQGRRGQAAELLGISRKHLWDLMRRHAIKD